MAGSSVNAGRFDVTEFLHLLDDEWRNAIVHSDGNLNKSAYLRNIHARRRVPQDFYITFRGRYPDFNAPDLIPLPDEASRHPLPPRKNTRRRIPTTVRRPIREPDPTATQENPHTEMSGESSETIPGHADDIHVGDTGEEAHTHGDNRNNENTNDENAHVPNPPETSLERMKRKFSWIASEWAGDKDELNARNADGTLVALSSYTGPYMEDGVEISLDAPVPPTIITSELVEYWNSLYDINGQMYYDSEKLALGSLAKSEYMLIPSNWPIDECPIPDVGAGWDKYKVPIPIVAGVYALAKEQARDLKMSEDDQIKWAVLRMEAFKSGWFARQKYTMFKPAPNGSIRIMVQDSTRVLNLAMHAYNLCAFLPFMAEYHFRAFGSAYTKSNSVDYVSRAQDLATSASLTECLSYMDKDTLHGKVLAWIGVKRPMQVLRNATAIARLPNPFVIRAYAAPAGQAIITSSIAIIDSINASGWWAHIKRASGYSDEVILRVGAAIGENPWKYHLMYHAYGEDAPNPDEVVELNTARKAAVLCAPILQAYVSTVMRDTPLAKIKALQKHANANMTLLNSSKKLFERCLKEKVRTVGQVFAMDAFQLAGGSNAEEERRNNAT